MGTLRIYSIKLKKLNKTSTFPFYISSYRHDMITFEHLIERTKPIVCIIVLFYFISNLVFFLK